MQIMYYSYIFDMILPYGGNGSEFRYFLKVIFKSGKVSYCLFNSKNDKDKIENLLEEEYLDKKDFSNFFEFRTISKIDDKFYKILLHNSEINILNLKLFYIIPYKYTKLILIDYGHLEDNEINSKIKKTLKNKEINL